MPAFIDWIGDRAKEAVDPNKHGFLSGNYSDFQLGINNVLGIAPRAGNDIFNTSIKNTGSAIGSATASVLSPINYSPAGYLLIGGGIIGLIIAGFVVYKVGKYL